jgi:HD-GYP domain-containing protein (c-di-GMP phosphodiesterase class II)
MRQELKRRKRLYEQHLHTLNEICHALGKKDRYTQVHGCRVSLYAMRLARRLGWSPTEVRNVGIGGLFHDVGKLALSDRIFTNRETRLPRDLQQEVRCHPLIGAALLKDMDFLKPAVDFVLFHHEQEDGNGYPFGLRAGEIPPGAKIVSIADCFDAVTTDRHYQKGQSAATAYEILRQGCRRFFCEDYVETFIEEIEENGIIQDPGLDPLLVHRLVRSAAGCSAG